MSIDVIAIDGPAASGKSTIASHLARLLSVPYVNTGNMYRAVTLFLQQHKINIEDEKMVVAALKNLSMEYRKSGDGGFILTMNGVDPGEALRSPQVAAQVSPVAALVCVRDYLKKIQRESADKGMIVMEGRDIGSVIFPDARWKFFVTASPEVRAKRRLAQAGENFTGATLAEVAAAIAERDRIDSTRAVAPLCRAPGAVLVDTSDLTIDEALSFIVKQIKE